MLNYKAISLIFFFVTLFVLNLSVVYSAEILNCENCPGWLVECEYDEMGQLSHVTCEWVDEGGDCHNCPTTEFEEN